MHGLYGRNGVIYLQDNLWTDGDTQYAVWVDWNNQPRIASRTLPGGVWSATASLNFAFGAVFEDVHWVMAVGVDSDGYIHVAGDMHEADLNYIRSAAPGVIGSGAWPIADWTTPGMIGTEETDVSYPAFFKTSDGTLFFSYRDGVSGLGDAIINRYDTATATWERLGTPLIDGVTDGISPYLHKIACGTDGSIHLMFEWRDDQDADTNHDICYMKSLDGGDTWTKADGTAYTLPVRIGTAEVIYPIAVGEGLLNQNGLVLDADNNPHGAFFEYDGLGGTNIVHIWHNGTIWQDEIVKTIDGVFDLNITPTFSIARPAVVADSTGRVWVLYRSDFSDPAGTLNIIEVTPGGESTDQVLVGYDLADYEPTYDTQAMRERDELHMVVIKHRMYGAEVGDDVTEWTRRVANVYTFDLLDL